MKDSREVLKTICEVCGGSGKKSQVSEYDGFTYHEKYLIEAIDKGDLPPFWGQRELAEKYDRHKPYNTYAVQVGMSLLGKILFRDRLDVVDMYNGELDKSMPKGLFPDGSKGQWRACHKFRLKTYEWFLEMEGDD